MQGMSGNPGIPIYKYTEKGERTSETLQGQSDSQMQHLSLAMATT